MAPTPLDDGVVALRSWEPADAPAIVECCNGDEELAGWLDRLPQPYTLADAEFYIGMDDEEKFAVTDAETGRVLGSIGLRWDEAESAAEVGYWLRADARGRGAMSRALVLVTKHALAAGAARVFLRADPENVASCRVAEKAGFTLEGVLRSAHWNPRLERRQDWTIYSLLPDDYAVRLYEYTIGDLSRQLVRGGIELVEPDPAWAELFDREATRLRSLLGDTIVLLEHAGSTSVPGLPAKPIVDIVMEVPDTTDEPTYVPALEAAGYELRIREPDWFEHRLFKGPDTNINLHVFPAGCEETRRMLAFRDWLRSNDEDRERYATAKRDLAARDWQFVQQYADAKGDVVGEIMARVSAT